MKLHRDHGTVRRPTVVCLLSAAMLLVLTGCLVIPVDYYQFGSRRNVSPATSEKLIPGSTSREEVLLQLGEPDFVSDDGERIGYAWTKVKALIFVASYGGGGEVDVERSYVLVVSFTPEGLVSQGQLLKEWGPGVMPIQEQIAKP